MHPILAKLLLALIFAAAGVVYLAFFGLLAYVALAIESHRARRRGDAARPSRDRSYASVTQAAVTGR